MGNVLIIASSAKSFNLADGKPHPTGVWAEELWKPLLRFEKSKLNVVVSTPDGKPPIPDPYSLEYYFHYLDEDEDFFSSIARTFDEDSEDIRLTLDHLTQLDLMSSRNVFSLLRTKGLSKKEAFNLVATSAKESWRKNKNLLEILKNKTEITTHIISEDIDKCGSSATINAKTQAKDIENGILNHPLCSNPKNINSFEETEINQFDVVFIPGGHGPMVDLYNNEKVGEIITHINSKNGTVGALCHGPAALMSTTAKNGDGSWLFEGYKMTVFTDEEELQTRPGKLGIPWYLEGSLRNLGGILDTATAPWTSHVVVDRNLITGQNPASAEATADAIIDRLSMQGVIELSSLKESA